MAYRLSAIALLLAVGLLVGTVAQPQIKAQEQSVPVKAGDKIRLLYEGAGARPCDVEAIAGAFVKCRQGATDGLWLNLATTLGVDGRR